jgi:hypothetical protein
VANNLADCGTELITEVTRSDKGSSLLLYGIHYGCKKSRKVQSLSLLYIFFNFGTLPWIDKLERFSLPPVLKFGGPL